MKKELICVDNLDAFICKQDGKLYVDQGRILTPGAKDELARRGVTTSAAFAVAARIKLKPHRPAVRYLNFMLTPCRNIRVHC